MALSLLCKQCNTLLASVAEAQNHSDVTGHVQFEESTQAIKREVCTVCGKACRSDAEKKLHSRNNPGHDQYVEKTEEASALDTEAQMAQAKLSAQEEMDADAELLGVKRKKMAAAAAAAAAGAGAGAAGAAGTDAGEAGTSGEAGAEGMDVDEEKVPVEVNEQMLGELTAMGFGANRATRALHAAGNSSVEGAINWLSEHDTDADIDEPLLIPKSQFKKPLSAEEARAKAEELMRRAKEKREAEERELEKHRERERIRAGKELQEAKRKEEEGRLQRIADERARQKAEDAKAREALRVKLEEDRKERRRKLGLPEELTEEEKAREAEKLKRRAAEEAAKHQVYVKPISVLDKLRTQLVALKKGAPSEDAFKTAATTLGKYIANVLRNADEDKFRRINTGNAAFQARVGAAGAGGVEVLETVGFQREADGTTLFMAREKADPEVLNTACSALSDAITNPFFGAL